MIVAAQLLSGDVVPRTAVLSITADTRLRVHAGPLSWVRPFAGSVRHGGGDAALLDQGQPGPEYLDVDLPGGMDQIVAGWLLACS